tara:strand:+ start:802 stop:2271 length:1470 start_codon:yes stop_codon:yes gene_type:complete
MSAKFSDNTLQILNPITNNEVGRFDISTNSIISDTIKNSKNYDKWSLLTVSKRCYHIKKLRKALVKHQDEIHNTLKNETGKPDFDILIEIFTTLEHLKEIAKIAKTALKTSKRNSGLMKTKKAYVKYEPLGIAGVISPWNYPLATPVTSIVEALLAGNNVVLKPSEHTPMTSVLIKKIWDEEIGFKDCFKILIGGADVGSAIVESKDIDIICFTGSTAVGKIIAEKCAKTLKPHLLELGGKDPMIVLKDAKLNRAVESALFGGLSNAGQTCISTEEVFIEKPIYEKFVEKISNRIKDIKSGGIDGDLGSMIMPQNTDKVNRHIREAEQSCKVLRGSVDNGDMYIAPTLVLEPSSDLSLVNEETFGPVLSLRSFSNENELLDMLHRTGYGLSSSIFGKNKLRLNRIVKQIKTGSVSINDVLTHYGIASIPFGGEGLSGVGRMHGKEGLRSLCRIKSVVENRFNFIDEMWWFGNSKKMKNLLEKAIKLLYS